MRKTLLASLILLVPAAAHAGPDDGLAFAHACWDTNATAAASLPDGSVLAGDALQKLLSDDHAPQAEVDLSSTSAEAGIAKTRGAQAPSWCAQLVNEKTSTGPRPLIVSAFGFSEGEGEQSTDVAMWAIPVPDASAGDADQPPALTGDGAPDASRAILAATSTKKLAALADPELVVAGSAQDQIYRGKQAKKKLAAWNLALTIDPAVASGRTADGAGAWVLANVSTQGKHGTITYRVLYGLVKKGKAWKLGLVHFALIR